MTRFLFGSSAGGHVTTPVTIANGGTGATSAQAALDALAAASGSLVQGDVFIVDSSGNVVRLARGADDTILKMNGSNPNWEAAASGGANTALSNLSSVAVNATIDMDSEDLTNVKNLKYKAPVGLTIASGIVTKSQNWFYVDTEGGAGTDDITNIQGGLGAGDEAHCMGSASVSRDPTFVDGTLIMAGNFTVDAQRDTIAFVEVATNEWYETTRSNNASFGWKCPNYVAYFSDDNEEKIISEMERTYHNIVPAVVVDKTDSNKIDLKYFSNGNLITIPKSNYGINEHTLYEKMRQISKKHLKKHIIQNSSKSVKQKEQEIKKFFV